MDDSANFMANGSELSLHSGFPNPALDVIEQGRPLNLDLNQLLLKHPSSTYLFRISGHQWQQEGIFDGDIAIIDRARSAQATSLVISCQDAGFTICRRNTLGKREQPWGIVSAIIHQY